MQEPLSPRLNSETPQPGVWLGLNAMILCRPGEMGAALSCPMNSIPGFTADGPSLPVDHSYTVMTDGVPEGYYECIHLASGGAGMVFMPVDTPGQGVIIQPED
jgi:hypothetical protein